MGDRSLDEPARLWEAAPDDGLAAFEYASALDAADREPEAIPVYRRAAACDLSPEVEYRALVRLGSCLRVAGDAAGAVALHQEVCRRWPERSANRLLLALALSDAGESSAALVEVLSVALALEGDEDIDYYRRALATYTELLHQAGVRCPEPVAHLLRAVLPRLDGRAPTATGWASPPWLCQPVTVVVSTPGRTGCPLLPHRVSVRRRARSALRRRGRLPRRSPSRRAAPE